MGAFGGIILTNKGRNLQAKAQTGVELKYTRMAIGDGQLSSQSIPTMTKLISEKKSLPLTKLKVQGQGRVVVGAVLSNQDVTTGFYFRELGVFATDPDEGEILYGYGNSGTNAEFIPPAGGEDIIEKSIDMNVIVGQAPNVSAVIDSSLVWATQDDVTAAVAEAKEYTDIQIQDLGSKLTPEQIGAASKAEFDAHVANADIHVTKAKQDAWNAKETTAGAQAKANQAEMNAKNYVNGLAWQKSAVTDASGNAINISSQDLNIDIPTGWYMGNNMVNAPSTDWHYVEIIRHNNLWCCQRAINFNNGKESMRVKSNGVWSAWKGVGDVLYKKPRAAVFNATLQDKVWTEVLTVNGSGRINHIAANASTGNVFVHLSITIDGVTQILEDRVNSGGNQLLGLYRDSGISGSAATDIFPNVSFESNFSLKIMQDTGSLRSTTVFVDYALV